MSNDFGSTLKHLRERAGLSLQDLATLSHYSKPLIGKVESGDREATAAFAEACDEALGTTPLLEMLCGAQARGDAVRRRVLLEHVGVLMSAGVGMAGLAEVVRQGLLADAGIPTDWEETVADYAREFVVAPSQAFGARLLQDMMLLRRQIRDEGGTADLFRAAAGLANFYGLWLGNQGDFTSARRQYRAAATLADHSGDTGLGNYIRGRAAARGTYEGATVRQTEITIARILNTTKQRSTIGALEAYSAEAHLGALLGDADRGRRAVLAMRRISEHLPPNADVWGAVSPVQRAAHLSAYVEGRVGSPAEVERACAEALLLLGNQPMWVAEVHQYRARAMVAAGDIDEGVRYALQAARSVGHSVRVISVAIRDVVDHVPDGWRSDDLDALRAYASHEPGPWATLR